MRLTRLEIFGFKSFVDRFVLHFDRDMIGVVGPNGCGKSNIVDALRWVLGETHAKHLRGAVLEDLIFNGTQSRRPLGMAEVSITIRPSEKLTPQSVAHGAISQPVAAEPAPELAVGEETAGESAPAPAPEEVQDLSAPSALLEIPGLFEAAEIQLTRRMYRSGESEYFINRVPCRLRDMLELYRVIGLGARGLSIVEQGQIGDFVSKKPLERRELLEEAAGISGFRNRLEVAQRKLQKTAENLARLQDIRIEVEKQVKVLSRQAKRARERGELKERLRTTDFDVYRYRMSLIQRNQHRAVQRRTELEELRAKAEAELEKIQALEGEKRGEIEAFDLRLSGVRSEKDALVQRVNEHVAKENQIRLELSRMEGRIRLSQSNFERAESRQGELRNEIARINSELENLAKTEERLSAERQNSEGALAAIIEQAKTRFSDNSDSEAHRQVRELNVELERLPSVTSDVATTERSLRDEQRKLQEVKRQANQREVAVASLRAEVLSLESQLKTLTRHITENTGEGEREVEASVLLAGIAVPEELQRSVSAVLGEKARFAIVEDVHLRASQFEAKKGERKNKRPQLGVFDKSYRSELKPMVLSEEDLRRAPSARPLVELLGISESSHSAASEFLGCVVFVETLSEAIALVFGRSGETRTAVTRDGELATAWGWYTTSGDGAELAFRRLINERSEALRGAEERFQEATAVVRGVEEGVRALEERYQSVREEREKLLQAQKRLSALLRDIQQAERAEREAALREERQAGEVLRRITGELAGVQRSISLQRNRLNDVEGEIVRLENDKVRLQEERQTAESQYQEQKHSLTKLIESFQGAGDGASPLAGLQVEIKRLEEVERQIGHERSQIRHAVGQLAQQSSESRSAFERHRREEGELGLKIERASVEREMIREEMVRYYGPEVELPPESEIEALTTLETNELETAIQENQNSARTLRQRMEREGEVDPQSIELYEQEKKRLEDLETQSADLTSASQTLERTIRQLKEISRTRFLETFKDVSARFAELVPRLFGGGSGSLELINPDDPLISGVDLVVRPPGKKLRSIDLMSGGEKALAATAILVAMFLHRPSPVCVLDEVDAPLDDANLDRFLGLIKEISRTTQFLIITHNKQSMMAADRLVGITMEERGVSKALTVTLDEAVEQLEQAANA